MENDKADERISDWARIGSQFGLLTRCWSVTSKVSELEAVEVAMRQSTRVTAVSAIVLLFYAWRPEARSLGSATFIGAIFTALFALATEFLLTAYRVKITEHTLMRMYAMFIFALLGCIFGSVLSTYELFTLPQIIRGTLCNGGGSCETTDALNGTLYSFIITTPLLYINTTLVSGASKLTPSDYMRGTLLYLFIHIMLFIAYVVPSSILSQ